MSTPEQKNYEAIARLDDEAAEAGREEGEAGEYGSEDLYQHEFDAGLSEDLSEQLGGVHL